MHAHHTNLWTFDRPLRMPGGVDMGQRMTVVRLASGDLWVHSPVDLDEPTRRELKEIGGDVAFVVAPCKFHHFYLEGWKERFPSAVFLAAPGLAEKRKNFRFDGTLEGEGRREWDADLGQLAIAGAPATSEVVFLHRPSRTLILTDFAFNIPPATSLLRKVQWNVFGFGGFRPSRLMRFAIKDRGAYKKSLDEILSWDFDRVILSHGEIIETGGKAKLREAYAFLREQEKGRTHERQKDECSRSAHP